MMRLIALTFAALAGAAHAATVAVPAAPVPHCANAAAASCTSEAPFLWEVQGAKTKHYLMGSVHLLPASAYPLPAALDAAYSAADTLVFESDLAALADPKTQMQMLAEAQSAAGLEALIGAELYAKVQAFARDRGLTPQVCDSFKPWFCALTLELLSFERSDYRPDLGLDQHYYARAKSVQKAILWLEEPAAHLKLFTAMPEPVAAQLLTATLEESGSDGATPEELLRAWQSNDVATLEQLSAEFKHQQPQLYDRLLAARNRAWLPRLTAMFGGDGTHLIVVGAAHLVGPDGLVDLLKARGYTLRPVVPGPAVPPSAPDSAAKPAGGGPNAP